MSKAATETAEATNTETTTASESAKTPKETTPKETTPNETTTTEEKPEDGESLLGKKIEEVKSEKVVPEKYEFTAPEGMEIDTAFLEVATPILKELKLDQTEAEKLFGLMVKKTEADVKRYNDTVDGWKQKTIKELGTDYQTKLALTSRFIDKFAGKRGDEVRQILNDTGVGSHPAVVHLFMEAGKFFSEDTLATGVNKNTPNDPERIARKMFPNTKFD
jgi:hypothetical protein